jgi:hypothetical protein
VGSSALHVDSTRAVALAVAARAVNLAVVFSVEVDNLFEWQSVSGVAMLRKGIHGFEPTLTVPQPLCWMTLSLAP